MLTGSQRPLHYGVNFLIAPCALPLDTNHQQDFIRFLSDNQIEFARTEKSGQIMKFLAHQSEPLEVVVKQAGPQVSQLLVLAPQPTQPMETIVQQCELICRGFQSVWSLGHAQIINRDACIRYLYQSKGEHAFKYIWEDRLKQDPKDMKKLNRPVLGGGLRFVMPPNETNKTQAQIKIESFLNDSRMLFVELQFAWPYSATLEDGFKPGEMLTEMQQYCTDNVVPFITGGKQE